MNQKKIIIGFILILTGLLNQQGYSQYGILRKAQSKAEDKLVNKLFKEDAPAPQTAPSGNNDGNTNNPANSKGSGLNNVAPDVNESLTEAIKAADEKKYADARDAIRKAIIGVEIEIGKLILKDLPNEVHKLPMVSEEDNVTSTGVGFVGLVIDRVYRKQDQQLKLMIGNDAGMLSAVNMYWASGMYQTNQDPNVKEVKYKGYKALLNFDESSGYTLSVPFGQTSLITFEGINFENEAEIMAAANEIDIEKIKRQLGEQ